VNRTPDSFYDGGANVELDRALLACARAVEDGADIVDIGGVRAGYGAVVDAAEELGRVLPVVSAIRGEFPQLVISVDTWRAEVAREVVAAGCDLLNDTWAGADPGLVAVAAETGTGLVCSHTGGLGPRTDPHRVHYDDVVADVIATVVGAAERAVAAGVRADGIVIDPTHRLAGTGRAEPQGLHRRDAGPAHRRSPRGHPRRDGHLGLARRSGVPRARCSGDPAGTGYGGLDPGRATPVGEPARPRLIPV